MIKIRLQRHGARHAPFYRMVVATSTARRDGKFIEVLGTYNPQAHARTEELKLKWTGSIIGSVSELNPLIPPKVLFAKVV